MLQKETAVKKSIEYLNRENETNTEQYNVKYSTFYGPFGLIGMLGYYRKHYKVHGQPETVITMLLPEL